MAVFNVKKSIREKEIRGHRGYKVREDGVVIGRSGLALQPQMGRYVILDGDRLSVAFLVARAFVGNAEGRQWVRHRNGDVRDNRAENLEWCDEKEDRRKKIGLARDL